LKFWKALSAPIETRAAAVSQSALAAGIDWRIALGGEDRRQETGDRMGCDDG
jgi:hypothetical protein